MITWHCISSRIVFEWSIAKKQATVNYYYWTYDRIKEAYGASHSTIAGIAQRFVTEGMESALGRKEQKNRHRKVTGDVEARICAIACSTPPEGASRWTMQAIADELIRLEVVDYITDSTVCNVMKKTKLNRGLYKEDGAWIFKLSVTSMIFSVLGYSSSAV